MKFLAMCIAISFFPLMKAQATVFPRPTLPHVHLSEEDTKDCEVPQEFEEAGEEYGNCFDCMFPADWLATVLDQLDPEDQEKLLNPLVSQYNGEYDSEESNETRAEEAIELVRQQTASIDGELNKLKSRMGKMKYPVVGGAKFLSGLGAPRSGGRRHQGVDLGAKTGTPIIAVLPGRVLRAGSNRLGGNMVRIEHPNGLTTYYAHLSGRALVKTGELVSAGEKIGYVGSSGNARGTTPHLHFEIRSGRQVMNPVTMLGIRGDSAPNTAVASDYTKQSPNEVAEDKKPDNKIAKTFGKIKIFSFGEDKEDDDKTRATADFYQPKGLPGVKVPTYGFTNR